MAPLAISPALCALFAFVGLGLLQAFLSRRVTRATRAAITELRGAMKTSFQYNHASMEILAKMLRAHPGERVSIEMPHAPEFMAAPAAVLPAAAPASRAPLPSLPVIPEAGVSAESMPARPTDGHEAPIAAGPHDATPESQRPTIAMVTTEASRPTVVAAKHGGLSAALEAIEAAALGQASPTAAPALPEGEEEHTHVMKRPPGFAPPSIAPVTPTRVSARTPAAERGEA